MAKIVVLYNVDWQRYPPGSASYEADADVKKTAEAVAAILEQRGHSVRFLTVDADLAPVEADLAYNPPDLVFNLVESLGGEAVREPEVPELFERFGVRYTGNTAQVLRTANAKDRVRALLAEKNVAVPPGVVSERGETPAHHLNYPLFVKPARTDASIGIDQNSVVRDAAALEKQLQYLSANYPGPYVIEEYLPGREINVAIFPEPYHGNYVCTEIDFFGFGEDQARIVTYDCKWRPGTADYNARSVPGEGRFPEARLEEAKTLARAAFLAIGANAYGRVDLRIGKDDRLYAIDINPNPDISAEAGLSIAAQSIGVDHAALIAGFADTALAQPLIRPIRAADREPLRVLLSTVENFTEEEQKIALELIDAAIRGAETDYLALVAEQDGAVRGYICYGRAPMTQAAWDLYWVAVDAKHRGSGIGKRLTRAFEQVARREGGRIIRIETSSLDTYGGTLEFYLREGYTIASHIEDFYKPGDDLITLVKRFV